MQTLLKEPKRLMMREKKESHASPTVAFRLETAYHKRLEKLAPAYNMSAHELARQIVLEYLDDAERLRLRERMTALEVEQRKLRVDLATSVAALLHYSTGGALSVEDAKEWVAENLLRT